MLRKTNNVIRHVAVTGLLVAGLPAVARPIAAVPTLHYTLAMPLPQSHYFEVKMEMGGFSASDYTDVKMPVWAPGSYLVREYAKMWRAFRPARQADKR